MFNVNLLKAKIVEKGQTALELANAIGVCEATFYQKLLRTVVFRDMRFRK